MAARRRRRRKNKNGTLFFCIVVEIIAVLALIGILGWRYGVADWISQIGKPVVQELDISGINSSHAVLMQARGRQNHRRDWGRGDYLSGLHDQDHDGHCGY